MSVAATHPQQSPPEDVLDVVRAMAKLAAHRDHQAEIEFAKDPILLIDETEASKLARCSSVDQFRLLVKQMIFPAAYFSGQWDRRDIEAAVASVIPWPEIRAENSEVYFVQSGDFIKIGYSKNVSERLVTMQTGSPTELILIATIPGSVITEERIHRLFERLYHRGEWFRRTPQLMAYIDWLVVQKETVASIDRVDVA